MYTAASGMMLQMARQDVAANNLANVNTAGYKRSSTVARAFPTMLMSRLGEVRSTQGQDQPMQPQVIGALGTGACLERIITDYSIGNLKQTNNPTDLALTQTDHFLAVETPEGVRYTRNGSLKVNGDGLLTTHQGHPILDDRDDYIYLEADFTIDRRGIITVNGEEVARLQVVRFADQNQLEKLGGSLVNTDQEPEWIEAPDLLQGYIEESNVMAVQEMVTLINVVRSYEALQKVVQAEDELTQTAIDQVGRV